MNGFGVALAGPCAVLAMPCNNSRSWRMANRPPPLPLRDWTLLSLRPAGHHGGVRAAAARRGARVLALSPLLIRPCRDAVCRKALQQALAARVLVATSPNAVRAAAALRPLAPRRGQHWIAIGRATARALAHHGITAECPAREDSEGLLALPSWTAHAAQPVGLLTAPGGRDLIAPALTARGHAVRRADVYQRLAHAPSAGALRRWRRLRGRQALLLSSGEALQSLLAALDAEDRARLRRVPVVAASERLATLARRHGFAVRLVASGARPAALLQALAAAAGTGVGQR
jgi:uroporphyrinogen-III synthase